MQSPPLYSKPLRVEGGLSTATCGILPHLAASCNLWFRILPHLAFFIPHLAATCRTSASCRILRFGKMRHLAASCVSKCLSATCRILPHLAAHRSFWYRPDAASCRILHFGHLRHLVASCRIWHIGKMRQKVASHTYNLRPLAASCGKLRQLAASCCAVRHLARCGTMQQPAAKFRK